MDKKTMDGLLDKIREWRDADCGLPRVAHPCDEGLHPIRVPSAKFPDVREAAMVYNKLLGKAEKDAAEELARRNMADEEKRASRNAFIRQKLCEAVGLDSEDVKANALMDYVFSREGDYVDLCRVFVELMEAGC